MSHFTRYKTRTTLSKDEAGSRNKPLCSGWKSTTSVLSSMKLLIYENIFEQILLQST